LIGLVLKEKNMGGAAMDQSKNRELERNRGTCKKENPVVYALGLGG
jgi:hypothetical protein